MDALMGVIGRHRAASVACLLVVALLTTLTVARCSVVNAGRQEAVHVAVDPEDAADAELGAARLELRDRYDATTQEIVDLLQASLWVGSDEARVAGWTGRTLYMGSGEDEDRRAYVITAASHDEEAGPDGKVQTWTFALETADESAICELVRTLGKDGNASSLTLSCPLLPGTSDWEPCWASGKVDVTEIPEGWLEERSTTEEAVEEALTSWCALNAPTATTAEWDLSSSDDWEEGYTSIKLTLDNRTKAKVEVRIAHEGGTIAIGRA